MDVATCDALLFSNGSRAEALAAIEATCREAGGSPWLERRFNVFRGCGQRVQDELMLLLAAVVMEKPTTDFMLHAG